MANLLPDEIIAEILSPALSVSEADFSSTAAISPFMTMSESSSAFLLVSKAWLRVATPLLYNVVVLRSKAQAQALVLTLTSNPSLSRWIRKLRVEGGYAISMKKILTDCTNITDLFLSLAIQSPDNACGICRALPLINPTRVILLASASYGRLYPEAAKLFKKLCDRIPTWTNMVVFEVTLEDMPWHTVVTIANALRRAPSLTTVVISDLKVSKRKLHSLVNVASNPSLKLVQIKSRQTWYTGSQPLSPEMITTDTARKFYKLLSFPNPSPVERTLASFVYPARLAADPLLEDAIWNRVLYFALDCRSDPPKWNGSLPHYDYTPIAPILVCKKFARLGIPHLCRNPVLGHSVTLRSFEVRLCEEPYLGQHVRSLTVTLSDNFETQDHVVLTSIISHTPFLVELHGGTWAGRYCLPIPFDAFVALGKSCGFYLSTFKSIPVSGAAEAVDPNIFSLFPRMRCLDWDSPIAFERELSPVPVPTDTLRDLVQLEMGDCDPSFLEILSQMELPYLRVVMFSAKAEGGLPLLQKHGSKLEHLMVSVPQLMSSDLSIFHHCPSVTVLGISWNRQTEFDFNDALAESHACLERIVFRYCLHSMTATQRTSLGRFLTSLDASPFPALRQIEHAECQFPTTDREMLKSNWVKWAESLLDQNIQLVGTNGIPWRRRLKYVPGGSRSAAYH
ncbi:hypothetical protein C8R46DRAFT_335847 [Mycena filopes]|nr:hypothetical protein C8R46DRAFT_335847 [Mycena filopes]